MWILGISEASNFMCFTPLLIFHRSDGRNRMCLVFLTLSPIIIIKGDVEDSNRLFACSLAVFTLSNLISWETLASTVPTNEESKQYTIFPTSFNVLQFTVLPFGLVSVPATFSRLIRQVLGGLPGSYHFLDNILLFTKTWEEHLILIPFCYDNTRVLAAYHRRKSSMAVVV